jgi:DNA repair protein RadC
MKIKMPEDVKTIWNSTIKNESWYHEKKEAFVVFFLNTRNEIEGWELISLGTINASLVHPREVFREAISNSSVCIVLAHNHPSGDTSPSREDISITRKLIKAGAIIDIPILDSLIVGDDIYSMRESGLLDFNPIYKDF